MMLLLPVVKHCPPLHPNTHVLNGFLGERTDSWFICVCLGQTLPDLVIDIPSVTRKENSSLGNLCSLFL